MPSHFIAQFTEAGGPSPQLELDRIEAQTEPSDESPQNETAWFPTRLGARGWTAGDDAQCLVFCKLADGRIDAIRAKVLGVGGDMPNDRLVGDFYSEHEFNTWWRIAEIQRCRFDSIDEIPGESTRGKPASRTFAGNATFSFWSFGSEVESASIRQGEQSQRDSGACVTERLRRTPEGRALKCSDQKGGSTTIRTRLQAPQARRLAIPREPNDTPLLHGVDFSGAAEPKGRGNGKLWIATWDLKSDLVSLDCGAEGGFCRSDLPGRVVAERGWWVFDFPFGIARETAEVIQVSNWHAWLNWCYGNDRPRGYATMRRDAAKVAVENAGVKWATRRRVDDSLGTTWFPLFEQLYRQTVCGAAEVLHPLVNRYREEVAVLPWDSPTEQMAVVVEGFPGVVIRERLGLPATGYKGTNHDRRCRREVILRALIEEWQVPVAAEDVDRAVEDTEGDAVDALVLLLACEISHALRVVHWRENLDRLVRENLIVEGWFPK